MLDVGVVTHSEHLEETMLRSLALRLRFPVHPAYERIDVYRSTLPTPESFTLLAELFEPDFEDGVWYDEGLVDAQTYYYRFQAAGTSGEQSCLSPIVQGTARLNPIPPQGWFFINSGSETTGSLDVLLTLNMSTGAQWYRVSNDPVAGSAEPWVSMPAVLMLTGTLNAAPGTRAWVYVQYFDATTGLISNEEVQRILYDPFGDPDGDDLRNWLDPDDDGDGLLDQEEIYVHHTDGVRRGHRRGRDQGRPRSQKRLHAPSQPRHGWRRDPGRRRRLVRRAPRALGGSAEPGHSRRSFVARPTWLDDKGPVEVALASYLRETSLALAVTVPPSA